MTTSTAAILGSVAQLALIAGSSRSLRSIGGIVAQLVTSESHVDELEITEHPVEQGASITDHAFKLPPMLTLRYSWSKSPSPQPGLKGLIPIILPQTSTDITDIYNKLLALQDNRTLVDVYTGKRAYRNMLIQRIEQDTEETSEYTLPITITLKQIILVSATSTATPGVSPSTDPNAVTSASLSPVQHGGTFQLLPAPTYNPPRTTVLNAGP